MKFVELKGRTCVASRKLSQRNLPRNPPEPEGGPLFLTPVNEKGSMSYRNREKEHPVRLRAVRIG